ncbi:HEAT repeat domain-containing protein [Mariniblastus fucicola]|uniref:HEAT repeat domain-containing protein n=1 Tax=Mariniblastus fucicola TaxID=980251 RepID=UPI000946476B|nr:HEAT repeat domain-containing protein [Mariniblastus fucicola]
MRLQSSYRLASVTLLAVFSLSLFGCAEGQFWRTGKYAPWVRKKWEAEEQIADTLFARKKRMTEAVASVAGGTVESQQEVAQKLSEVILRDPILLLRLHALKLITSLDCPKTADTLAIAASDPSSDIRIATVEALKRIPGQDSIYQLQEILANDTDDDVRIAATRALGNFQGQTSVRALALALEDRNPALQISATESLMRATGQQSIGRDVAAWQNYVRQVAPGADAQTIPGSNEEPQIAKEPSGGTFR